MDKAIEEELRKASEDLGAALRKAGAAIKDEFSKKPAKHATRQCPSCGSEVVGNGCFCPWCGHKVPYECHNLSTEGPSLRCSVCGCFTTVETVMDCIEVSYCGNCGAKVV